jgi:hypothetical protein
MTSPIDQSDASIDHHVNDIADGPVGRWHPSPGLLHTAGNELYFLTREWPGNGLSLACEWPVNDLWMTCELSKWNCLYLQLINFWRSLWRHLSSWTVHTVWRRFGTIRSQLISFLGTRHHRPLPQFSSTLSWIPRLFKQNQHYVLMWSTNECETSFKVARAKWHVKF